MMSPFSLQTGTMALRAKNLVNTDRHHEAHELKVNNRGLNLFLSLYEENEGELISYQSHDRSSFNIVKAIRFLRLHLTHFKMKKIQERSDRQNLNNEILGLMVSLLLTTFSVKPDLPSRDIAMLLEIFLGNATTPYLESTIPVMGAYAFPALFINGSIKFNQDNWYTADKAKEMVEFAPNDANEDLRACLCNKLVQRFDLHLQVGCGAHQRASIDLLRS